MMAKSRYSYRKVVNYTLLILITGLILEGTSYLAQQELVGRGIIYEPPIPSDYVNYLLERDPVLGWPSPHSFGKGNRDPSGSRIVPAFPDYNEEACVSLYGDSFTWGATVENEAAWSNVLSKRLNCRVSNFGVARYGTDQSYLRFKQNDHDRTKIVILGHLSENIVRNVTQFFHLLYGGGSQWLKPRFVIDEGSLKLIPLLSLSFEEYNLMVHSPEKFLKHDYLLPGGLTGISKAGIPYTYSVLKAFNNYRVKARLAGTTFWADFYREDHPSQALQITELIIKSFYQETLTQGRTPVVIIFPLEPDLITYQSRKSWVYQSLLDGLIEDNIDTLNIGMDIIQHLGQRDPGGLFRNGHYNEEGNRIVAKSVGDYLLKRHMIKSFQRR